MDTLLAGSASLTASPLPTLAPSPTASVGSVDWVAIGAVATFFTGVVALLIAVWGPWLRGLVFRPVLRVSIDMRPPDCIKIQAVLGNRSPNLPTFVTDSYHFRLKVTNAGNREAQDVEVKLLRLRVVPNGGPGREDRDFLPLNLKWSDSELITVPRIQPKLFKHCDLCNTLSLPPGGTPLMDFRTEVVPNQLRPDIWPTRKKPGNYALDIAVSANNAKVVYKTLRISFAGWFDDEAMMFNRGLVISVGN